MAVLDWKCQQCFDTCGRPDQEIHYVCVVQLWNYHPKEHSSNPYIFNHQWEIGIKIKSVQRHYSSENLWVRNNMWRYLSSCYVQMFTQQITSAVLHILLWEQSTSDILKTNTTWKLKML